jgi:hypothetical protein
MLNIAKRLLFLSLLYIGGLNSFHATAQPEGDVPDSLRMSLITCSPGAEVYELYGHTAILCENLTTHEDWVFNYGMFNFRTPHFIWRFSRGETDYQLGVMPYYIFESEYRERGSAVIKQTLNLTPAEALKLFILLDKNYRPENRTYRYNYFYDNCTTRARDRIEEAIGGRIVYPKKIDSGELNVIGLSQAPAENLSYRAITKLFTKGHPWAQFGNDMALGAQADETIAPRQQMFAPFYMMAYADGAEIVDSDGTTRPLVLEKTVVVPLGNLHYTSEFPLSPMACAVILLLVTVACCLCEFRTHRQMWLYTDLLYAAQGLAGCIVAFLFFCSSHPTVGSNFLIIIFNPLPLLCLPWVIHHQQKHRKCLFHWLNLGVLTLFMLSFAIIPQKFSLVIVPLALSLLIRSACQIHSERKYGK